MPTWKPLQLQDAEMIDFATGGGVTIEVMSNCSDVDAAAAPSGPAKKKRKTKTKKPVPEPVDKIDEPVVPGASTDMSAWSAYGLNEAIVCGLRSAHFLSPTPIQSLVVPPALQRMDVLGAAETGSGKTLAFGLPILHSILSSACEASIKALCVLPTRELAMQVKQHLGDIAGPSLRVGVAVGGMSVEKQLRVISSKPPIVIGTPGRLAALLGVAKETEVSQKCEEFVSSLPGLQFFVLDEADRLLEDSHFRDLTAILALMYKLIPSVDALQTFVFSATLPIHGEGLAKLVKRVRLKPAKQLFIADLIARPAATADETQSTTRDTKKRATVEAGVLPSGLQFKAMFPTREKDRESFLLYYLFRRFFTAPGAVSSGKHIVFVNAISYVYRLASLLPLCLPGVRVVGIHANLRQKDRLKRLEQFLKYPSAVMVATDLAARGLDLPNVESVIHLQPPRSAQTLVHRSGRTARAGRSGECVMVVIPSQLNVWEKTVRIAIGRELSAVDVIEAVSVDISRVRDVHALAAEIEGESHKETKERKEKSWAKKVADEAGLDFTDESGLSADDCEAFVVGDVSRSKIMAAGSNNGATVAKRAKLDSLLSNPLPSIRLRQRM